MKAIFKRFRKNEDGATAIEYGLIAALIAVVIIGAVTFLGTRIQATFNTVGTALQTATTPPAGN
ncbi:Flp family type IVb pilin [Pseudochrobactrum algeriensis]|uniref:Flp family type IVb pilin n=1 Tax=Pseudochrobactrum TaxID=354349 RepID=UPI000E25D58F|nr:MULTISPECIES: Flp family type IVb pilin [Pseudochrobactrum]MBX8813261.1 Flp family type IVb pilin [Ochrobactrum sp. MR34]QVQ37868.1 Flp family type IVb pilin [Pseudochrobactrum algeriensis]QVQ41091.1 Flp family type IVb pilin [Pseudochrobactrum algeriensis]QVQ45014.1 Flp family type IVb pilin [Pseudochrobactrum algeriensis]QYM72993.1 Flp family type IVb pilin [Pseudochrobactrum sp. Wa41.01b-1]